MKCFAGDRMMPQADFDALQKTLHWAARTMSREQIIELADGLFECSRARREPRSWQPSSAQISAQPSID